MVPPSANLPAVIPNAVPFLPPQAPPIVTHPESDADFLFFGLVRDIRAEAQNLARSIAAIETATEQPEDVRVDLTRAAIQAAKPIFAFAAPRIEQRISGLRSLMTTTPSLYRWYGDEITAIEDDWQRLTLVWPGDDVLQNLQISDVQNRVKIVVPLIDDIVYRCGFVTIPERINAHLTDLRVGQKFDVFENFKDEFGGDQTAVAPLVRILTYLRAHPTAVDGVVDAAQMLIFRASASRWRRILSIVGILLVVVLGGACAFGLPYLSDWLGIPLGDLTKIDTGQDRAGRARLLLGIYALVIAGGALHLVIAAVKQERNAGDASDQAFVATQDWPLWFHVKELSVIASVISLWVVFVGLAYSLRGQFGETKGIDAFAVLAGGYGSDSFVDIFLNKFTDAASARQTELLKTLA
jgi:hypothetical protein